MIIPMTLKANHDTPQSAIQFCALAYCPEGTTPSSESRHQIIIFLMYTPNLALRLLLSPEWRQVVRPVDLPYIVAILEDFHRRAEADPDGLFSQASSLAVGPLITYDSGVALENNADLHTLSLSFKEPWKMIRTV
jgi:hypothetical protein